MVTFDSRYFNYAHRISDVPLGTAASGTYPAVNTLYDGQWLMMDPNGTGNMYLSDGGAATGTGFHKAYITLSSKWGNPTNNIGLTIQAGRNGRDTVTSTGTVAVLIGPFRIATDQYLTGTYVAGQALMIDTSGTQGGPGANNGQYAGTNPSACLTAWNGTNASQIVAWVWAPPATSGAPMTITHE